MELNSRLERRNTQQDITQMIFLVSSSKQVLIDPLVCQQNIADVVLSSHTYNFWETEAIAELCTLDDSNTAKASHQCLSFAISTKEYFNYSA